LFSALPKFMAKTSMIERTVFHGELAELGGGSAEAAAEEAAIT
jgi:hypothetical protein